MATILMKDARFLSILLALGTLVCAGLGAEYLYRLDRPSARSPVAPSLAPAAAPLAAQPAAAAQTVAPTPRAQPLPYAEAVPEQHGILRKCIAADGKVSYTDKACATGEQARPLARAPDSTGLRPQRSYQQQLAEQSGRRTDAVPERQTATAGRISLSPPPLTPECANLLREIAAIDAALRQPHSPQVGDEWTAQRKRATDRRYALRCGQ